MGKDEIKKEDRQITAYDLEMKKLEIEQRKELEYKAFKEKNKYKIRGLFLAFLTLASLFDFGFFRTLGIWILMLVGYGIGAWFDKDKNFLIFLRKFLRLFR